MQTLKVPPHNLEIEQVVLGSMLLNPKCVPVVRQLLTPDDFYKEGHNLICAAIVSVDTVDVLLVAEQLRKQDQLERVGGTEYLFSLVEQIATSAGVKQHCQTLLDLSRRRKLINQCMTAADKLFSETSDLDEIESSLKTGIRDATVDKTVSTGSLKTIAEQIYKEVEAGPGDFTVGVLTGFENIDNKIYGLEPQCTYYLSAESSTGKTALALNIASYVAQTYQKKVLFFSLESTITALTRRLLSSYSNIPLTRIRTRNFREEYDWQKFTEAENIVCEMDQWLSVIDDSLYQTIERLSAYCETVNMDNEIGLVVIDYLQLLSSFQKFNNRHLELSYISKNLNFLAKNLKSPVLILSQLNKEGNLKESGDIFNNSDNVWRLEREDREAELAKLTCTKGKDSGTWTKWLRFDRFIQQFYDCEDQYEGPK